VYIPLGGNRRYQYRNIFIVWMLTGFWHGASWNFVIWGIYFGVLLLIEKAFLGKLLDKSFGLIKHLYALFFIIIGWALFYFTDLKKLTGFLKKLFEFNKSSLNDIEFQSIFLANLYWFILAILLCMPIYNWIQKFMLNRVKNINTISIINITLNLLFFIVSVILLVGSSYNPFIYFRF
jgi:alginate O-acetyltransferase complex protein AlgI